MRHAVIMAGGSGTRLWPLSRKMRPKQLLRIVDGESLLQVARRRLATLFDPQNIWIITSAAYVDLIAEQLPDIPRENLIGEPVGRDTANAIGLAAHLLSLRDPEGTMAVFTSDHLITPLHAFADSIRTGLELAEQHADSLVTFGVTPDSPHTGYGYVQRGPEIEPRAYRVLAFKEKPQRDVAEQYLASGEYFWNSGMFCWKLGTILRELERVLPENYAALREIAEKWGRPGAAEQVQAQFHALRPISIDFAVMEKARDVLVVAMNCKWFDLGSFSTVAITRKADEAGNVIIGAKGLAIGGGDNVLLCENDHLIVLLGLSDVVVVHSEDVTLVCHKDYEQRVRDVARLCQQRYGDRYE